MEGTRERLLQATMREFNLLGPMVPMARISQEAGIAAGTPFRYFKTKEELLRATYLYARESALSVIPQEDTAAMNAMQLVKHIVGGILYWSAVCPQEHQYVCKYEDMVCYDCFETRFHDELYVGVIEEMNIWPKLQAELRSDLPESLISRLISVNCSVYARFIRHNGYGVDSPEFRAMQSASADSIWNSIRRI
ncbi:MAG: helix-turn-helix domain containing protein [Eubacteriales bacterium]|nr:helix-turn-helix domain containing protein [Eubacteriales bacterium]